MSVLYLKTIDVFFKRKLFDKSVHYERKTQVRSNHIFHSVTLRIYIHMIENSRYSIKPQKKLFLEAADVEFRAVVVVVVLRDAVVEVFKAAQNVLHL